MRQLLTLGILCLSYISYSQIDWNSYEEADNTIKNLSLQASSNFSAVATNLSNNSFLGNLGINYSSRKVKDLGITNFSIGNQFLSDYENLSNSTNQFRFDLNHSHYFNDRRGLFVKGSLSGNYRFNNDDSFASDFSDNNQVGIHIGYGRMENISRVYQSIRINKSQNNIGALNQDKVFHMADALSQINYNDVFNNGSIDADKQARFISELESQGHDLSSQANLGAALNNFTFEIPNVLRQGKAISFGIEENRSFDRKSSSRSAVINLDYASAINDKWHFDSHGDVRQRLGGNNSRGYNLNTSLSYIPSARTRISFNNSLSYDDLRTYNVLSNSTSINASYAVSKNVSVFGNIGYNIQKISGSDILETRKFKGLFSGMGVKINF